MRPSFAGLEMFIFHSLHRPILIHGHRDEFESMDPRRHLQSKSPRGFILHPGPPHAPPRLALLRNDVRDVGDARQEPDQEGISLMIAIQLSRLEAPKIAITQRVKIADRLGEQQELGGHAAYA